MDHKAAQRLFRACSKRIDGKFKQWEKAKMAALHAAHLPEREP